MEIKNISENQFAIKGNGTEIDKLTKKSIKSQYDYDEEIKILRKTVLALINKTEIPDSFYTYNNYVSEVVDQGKVMKSK